MPTLVTCTACGNQVAPRRRIGAGTLIGVLLTGGFWLLALPFYGKVCPVCGSSVFAPLNMPASRGTTSAGDIPDTPVHSAIVKLGSGWFAPKYDMVIRAKTVRLNPRSKGHKYSIDPTEGKHGVKLRNAFLSGYPNVDLLDGQGVVARFSVDSETYRELKRWKKRWGL